jgi:ABC-2 type transport system ATP-binding protein
VTGAQAQAVDWWGTDAVSVRYGHRLALDQVTFRARPGQVSVVVGGDGAGRSTLLRCLGGALAASAGTVRRPPQPEIGYLPASSGTYPDLTVAENLAFRAAAYRVPAAVASERITGYLDRAGLLAARDRLAGRLSGGMRQKLGVIAALLPHPALLVLDEPTTGVDPVSRADLWSLITGAAAGGAAVVLATSYLDEAERAAHVLALDAGGELAAGTPEQIVAAMPGRLWASAVRPAGPAAPRSWRRDGRWRVWQPGGSGPAPAGGGELVRPDLQDAVTVAILRRELAAAAGPDRDRDLGSPAGQPGGPGSPAKRDGPPGGATGGPR